VALPKVPGTKIRGTTYHLNLAVPVELQAKYGGEQILRRTLRTGDPREAERQVRAQRAEFDAAILKRRMRAERDRLIAALDPDDRALLAELGGPEGLLSELKNLRSQVAFELASQTPAWAAGTDPAEIEEETRATRVSAARERAATNAELSLLNSEARRVKRLAKTLGEDPPPAPAYMQESAFGLRDLAVSFADAKGWTVQNRQALTYTVRRWIELHGDLPLEKITRQQLGEFARAASKLPSARIPARLPMPEAIALAERDGLARIEEKTWIRLIDHLKAMLAWAQDNGHVGQDPFAGYRLDRPKTKVAVRRQRKVKAFSPEQAFNIITYVEATFDKRTLC
jgi:hypothetical protein